MNAPLSAADVPAGFTFAAAHCGLKRVAPRFSAFSSAKFLRLPPLFSPRIKSSPRRGCLAPASRKSRQRMRGLIVNSGNANCCTHEDGYSAAIATAAHLAHQLASHPSQFLVCSTGVIGPPLRVEKIIAALPQLFPARRRCGRIRGIRPLDHDHGHAPEVGRHHLLSRWQKSSPSRLRERLRHDSAEYGHHARIHSYGRSPFARAARPRTSFHGPLHFQLHHRGWRYLHERHGRDLRQWQVWRAAHCLGHRRPITKPFAPPSKASACRSPWRLSRMAKAPSA